MNYITFRLLRRWVLTLHTALFIQLFAFAAAHAQQDSQADSNISGKDERIENLLTNAAHLSRRAEQAMGSRFKTEVDCLALNIYFEARGEKEKGQRAVGHVVMNRVKHSAYPNSVCEVVRQGGENQLHRCQFSWWCDGRSDKPLNQKAWNRSMRLARRIYFGSLEDTTDGALWYHATSVTPYWSKSLLQGSKIGQHVFYLENQQTRNTL